VIAAASAVLALLAGGLTGLDPHPASTTTRVDSRHIQLVNSASEPLLCVLRLAGGEWSDPFELAPAEQVLPDAGSDDAIAELLCNPPVRRARFNLRPGGRYALIPDPGAEGEVDLYSVEE
jgi:hypothetical protein